MFWFTLHVWGLLFPYLKLVHIPTFVHVHISRGKVSFCINKPIGIWGLITGDTHTCQDSLDQCPMPINADQNSGIDPNVDQFRSFRGISDQCHDSHFMIRIDRYWALMEGVLTCVYSSVLYIVHCISLILNSWSKLVLDWFQCAYLFSCSRPLWMKKINSVRSLKCQMEMLWHSTSHSERKVVHSDLAKKSMNSTLHLLLNSGHIL